MKLVIIKITPYAKDIFFKPMHSLEPLILNICTMKLN